MNIQPSFHRQSPSTELDDLNLPGGSLLALQAILRQTRKSACILLALKCLGRPAGAREISRILALNEHTASRYLRELEALKLVARAGYRQGYQLAGDSQLLFGASLAALKAQTSALINDDINIGSEAESGILITVPDSRTAQSDPSRAKSAIQETRSIRENWPAGRYLFNPHPRQDPELVEALKEAGILEPKRSKLADMPHLTPATVRAWKSYLVELRGKEYRPGLLIHVLEQDEAALPTNDQGHVYGCSCSACNARIFSVCPNCYAYPCECEYEGEECEDELDS